MPLTPGPDVTLRRKGRAVGDLENTTMEDSGHAFEGWAILELMGHRRLGGYVSEVTMFGASMCRIDVPGEAEAKATQFYGGSAVYCLTPTSEATARAVAKGAQPAPVHRWELPAQTLEPSYDDEDDDRKAF